MMGGKVVGFNPAIPDGEYLVRYCGYETGQSWNSCKVMVNFSVVEGEYSGTPLTRYYNAKSLIEPIGKNGDFLVGDRSFLVKEFRTLLPEVQSISSIDLNLYRERLIRVLVVTTSRSGTGEDISRSNQYSVIRKLIEIVPEAY